MRALILDPRSARASLAAARGLAADGWFVGIAAPDRSGLASVSRRVAAFHTVPPPEDGEEGFLAALNAAVAAGGYDLVFASSDVDVLAISAARDRIAARVPHPPHASLLSAFDKLELTAAAERAGLGVPRSAPADEPEALGLPVLVKERVHGDLAGGGAATTIMPEVLADAAAVEARVGEIRGAGGDVLLQEVVRGRLIALTVVCDDRSRIVARVQQEAVRTWPGDIGVSVRARTVPVDEALAGGVARLLSELGWFGLAELQFLAPPDGPPRLIDLNGRFYGSLALAIGAGVNLPAIWGRLALGKAVPMGRDASAGVRYQWLESDLKQARQDRNGGLLADALGCLAWAVGAKHSIFSASDPRPAFRAVAALVRERAS